MPLDLFRAPSLGSSLEPLVGETSVDRRFHSAGRSRDFYLSASNRRVAGKPRPCIIISGGRPSDVQRWKNRSCRASRTRRFPAQWRTASGSRRHEHCRLARDTRVAVRSGRRGTRPRDRTTTSTGNDGHQSGCFYRSCRVRGRRLSCLFQGPSKFVKFCCCRRSRVVVQLQSP